MNLFRIANGPWEKLFNGEFQEHEIELYSNPEKILLVLVYEKKLDLIEGAIVELYKVFNATGEVESFTETLPKEALIVTKHNENQTLKFLLLGSKPIYVRWEEEEFIREVDLLVKKLSTSATMIKDVSKAYELTLKEIAEAGQEAQIAFFAEPMLVPLLSTSSHTQVFEQPQIRSVTKGEIMLGITRDRKRIVEPLSLFTKTIVTDGEEKDRNRVLQVIGESALLSNIPSVFFDVRRRFLGIGEANKNIAEIQKFEVNIDPLGFPARTFKSKDSLKIDINLIEPEAIAELFGVGEKDFPRILKLVLEKGSVRSMNELIEKTSGMQQTEEFSEFKIRKSARVLKLMDLRYPNLFGGQNEIEEMIKPGNANIARASILELDSLDERSSVLMFSSLLRGICEYAKKKGESSSVRAMILLPHAQIMKVKEKQRLGAQEIYSILKELGQYGVAFALAGEHLIDIDQYTKTSSTAQINIVSENDVGVQLSNKKSYRVLVRPTLSKQSG